jgi:hypothetical protein
MSLEPDKNPDGLDNGLGSKPRSDFDLVAIASFDGGEVSIASIFESESSGYPEMDLTRWSGDRGLREEISDRRCFELGLAPLSSSTRFLSIIPPFSERTRILPLSEKIKRMDDEALRVWLVEADRDAVLGTDGHPLFDAPRGENSVSVSRLPDGNVSVTEVPASQINDLTESLSRTLGVGHGAVNATIETSSRACLRYFLLATSEGAGLEKRVGASGTALILLTRCGFSVSFWSPDRGLFAENGYPAPAGMAIDSEADLLAAAELDSYLRQAVDELFIQIETLESSGDDSIEISRIVWAAESGLGDALSVIMGEVAAQHSLEVVALDRPAEEAAACGLLLISDSIVSTEDARLLPQADLVRGLGSEAEVQSVDEEYGVPQTSTVDRQRRGFALAILGPPIAILAVIIGFLVHGMWISSSLESRMESAASKEAKLQPVLQRRREFEKSLAYYREVVLAVGSLRERQPLTVSLLQFLDGKFPVESETGFFVSELKLGDDGSMRGKGLARSKDIVIEFLRGLEQGRDGSGLPVFEGLTYTVREAELGASNVYVATDLSRPRTQYRNLAPGVVEWELAADFAAVKRNLAKAQQAAGAPTASNGGGAGR